MKKSKKIILTICIFEALLILCAFTYQLMESKNKSVIELDPSSYTFAQNEEGSLVMLNNVNTIDSNYSGTDRRLISPTIELNSGRRMLSFNPPLPVQALWELISLHPAQMQNGSALNL